MRVSGEAFLLMNGWMDFWCLYLAAAIRRTRFFPVRAAIAAGLGAGYAVWALGGPCWARSCLGLAGSALLLSAAAFGPKGLRLTPFVALSGWTLSGAAAFLRDRGWAAAWILLLCGCAAAAVGRLLGRSGVPADRGGYILQITWRGRTLRLPALRDSGNLLTDAWSGLPVIVASARALAPLLPGGVRPDDLATLPAGFRLIRAATAAGGKTLMCFVPDRTIVIGDGKRWRVEAAVALSGFREGRALLPEAIFSGKGERDHAGA